MLTYNSFLSFYSLFVNLMPFPLIISLISCNSFFSLFVSIQDRAGPIIKNHALRSQFLACFSPPYSGTISESQHTRCTHRVLRELAGACRPSTPQRAKP